MPFINIKNKHYVVNVSKLMLISSTKRTYEKNMRENTPMNDLQMKTFISQFCWIYAKTYAEVCPHEYIVKTKLDKMHWDSFEDAVKYIRDNGFDATYNKRVGKYYILDDYYYWTMGEPIEETTVLNRAKLSDYLLVNKKWLYRGKATERSDKVGSA